MVLKGVTEYSFYNNFTNIRSTGLKFWYNMGSYSGHPFLCGFDTQPDLLMGSHNGPAGVQ